MGDTVAEAVEAYIKDKTERGKASATIDGFNWKALKATFAHLRPDQVTRENTRAYRATRAATGISVNTIHRELAVLLAALRWQTRNTAAVVELPAKPPPKDRYLTR